MEIVWHGSFTYFVTLEIASKTTPVMASNKCYWDNSMECLASYFGVVIGGVNKSINFHAVINYAAKKIV